MLLSIKKVLLVLQSTDRGKNKGGQRQKVLLPYEKKEAQLRLIGLARIRNGGKGFGQEELGGGRD